MPGAPRRQQKKVRAFHLPPRSPPNDGPRWVSAWRRRRSVRTSPLSHPEEADMPVLPTRTRTPRRRGKSLTVRLSPEVEERSGRGSRRAGFASRRRSRCCSSSPCAGGGDSGPGTGALLARVEPGSHGRAGPGAAGWPEPGHRAGGGLRTRLGPRLRHRPLRHRPPGCQTDTALSRERSLAISRREGSCPVKRTDLLEMENLGPVYYWQGIPAPRAGPPASGIPGACDSSRHASPRRRPTPKPGVSSRPMRRRHRPTRSGTRSTPEASACRRRGPACR